LISWNLVSFNGFLLNPRHVKKHTLGDESEVYLPEEMHSMKISHFLLPPIFFAPAQNRSEMSWQVYHQVKAEVGAAKECTNEK
jgi:hypothetical protein